MKVTFTASKKSLHVTSGGKWQNVPHKGEKKIKLSLLQVENAKETGGGGGHLL